MSTYLSQILDLADEWDGSFDEFVEAIYEEGQGDIVDRTLILLMARRIAALEAERGEDDVVRHGQAHRPEQVWTA